MTAILKKMYKEKLFKNERKYNNPVDTSIRIELVEIKLNTYIMNII